MQSSVGSAAVTRSCHACSVGGARSVGVVWNRSLLAGVVLEPEEGLDVDGSGVEVCAGRPTVTSHGRYNTPDLTFNTASR